MLNNGSITELLRTLFFSHSFFYSQSIMYSVIEGTFSLRLSSPIRPEANKPADPMPVLSFNLPLAEMLRPTQIPLDRYGVYI